jgi:hypothetical protein
MPNNNGNLHVEATPHPDGEQEDIINDPTASAGSQMGVQGHTAMGPAQEQNPFNHKLKQDPEMQQFQKLLRGHKVEE